MLKGLVCSCLLGASRMSGVMTTMTGVITFDFNVFPSSAVILAVFQK